MKQLQDTIKDESELTGLLDGCFLIINVWRVPKQIPKDPPAICNQETDVRMCCMSFQHNWKELAKANYGPRHV